MSATSDAPGCDRPGGDDAAEAASQRAWVAALAQRDIEALALLYGRTSRHVLPVLKHMLRRRDLAEEALHDVYLKAWERAASYDPARGSVMAWLTAIARSTALDQLRRQRRELQLTEEDGALDLVPALPADASVERRALRACLDELEPDPRRCVLLAYQGGFTYEEMARRLDRPVNTIKSWVRRSLLRLRQCLESR